MDFNWWGPILGPVVVVLAGNLFLDDWLERRARRRALEGERARLRTLRWETGGPPCHERPLGLAVARDEELQEQLLHDRWPVAVTGKECGYCGHRWNPVLTTGQCPACGHDGGRMLARYVGEVER